MPRKPQEAAAFNFLLAAKGSADDTEAPFSTLIRCAKQEVGLPCLSADPVAGATNPTACKYSSRSIFSLNVYMFGEL